MPSIPRDHLIIGRVTHEDDDFFTVEFGKRDDVTFHLMPNDIEGNENAEQNRFFTAVFLRQVDGHSESWKPWDA